MKKIFFAAFVAMLLNGRVLAGCDWATETPADDSKYKYFVSRVYSEISESDAAKKAEQDIDAQIGRLYGTKLDVISEFYSDEIGASGTTRSYERTLGAITLKGLERQKGYVERKSKSWIGCVQYRYLKSEIEAEKKRLKNLSPEDLEKSLVFTEVYGDPKCTGEVKIVTKPSGAYVTLDNGKYQGTSPIKFGNVCNGKYSLEITHDNYDAVTQKLIVPVSGTIEKTLVRSTKKITVKTSIGNSRIEINGVDKGKEPVTFLAPLGVEQTITAINSEAVKVTQSRMFSKDSESTYIISMEKLPGKIDFTAFKKRNPGVDVVVDGSTVVGNTSKELASDRSHKVTFSKKGFYNIEKTVDIPGNETYYYPSQELTFSKEPRSSVGLYAAAGLDVYKNYGAGFTLGIDYKYDYLYIGGALDLNYVKIMDAKATVNGRPSKRDVQYNDLLRADLGINLGPRLVLMGVGTVGTWAEGDGFDGESGYGLRYGVGLQYAYKLEDNVEYGLRITYLTGKAYTDPEDSYYVYDRVEIKEKITSLNISFYIRGFVPLK